MLKKTVPGSCGAFELGVRVIHVAGAHPECLHRIAAEIDPPLEVVAVLVHVDECFCLGRQAVVRVELIRGDAERATVSEPRHAGADARAVARGIRDSAVALEDLAARGLELLAQPLRGLVARDADVVRLARVTVHAEEEAAGLAADSRDARALVERRVTADFRGQLERILGRRVRQAAVHDVDDAARTAAAVKQGRRPMQDLDPVGEGRLDRDGVVFADV